MISILVAYTKNKRVIGAQGKIPWKLSSERNRFKEICRDKYVIMGRKSFEEIGKPLPYCKLVIVTRDSRVKPENDKGISENDKGISENDKGISENDKGISENDNNNLFFKKSLEEAIDFCKAQEQEEILIAGGATIYEQALPHAKKIYATEIDANFEGDTFFPPLAPEWTSTLEETHEENGIKYSYLTYIRSSI